MANREQEIDVKLLLFAIQRTFAFETFLAKRFTGHTIEDVTINRSSSPTSANPFQDEEDEEEASGSDADAAAKK